MADEAQAPTFWSEVAQRYGNPTSPEYSPLVAFDLYNEPHNVSDAVWLNGGKTTDSVGGQTYQAAGMQQLYNSVRAAGSENLVFISGLNWASTPPSTLVKGSNIVYAVHYYTCPNDALSACTNSEPYDAAQDLSQWVGLSATEPVAVYRIRLALPGERHLRPQCDRLRHLARVGLECLRLGGSTVSDGVGPDPPLAR